MTSSLQAFAGPRGKDNFKLQTIVIDPGHGGHDPGCVSKDRQTYEKTLTLDIAGRFAAKIKAAYPDVKVVMTRNTDVFIPLNERAAIANRNNANLFVSIHINTAPKSSSAHGFSIHILGKSSIKNRDLFSYNMDVCKRENSVIMLEDDYTAKYQGFDPSAPESFIFFNLMQNAFLEQSFLFAQDIDKSMSKGPVKQSRGIWQDPFYVLWKTSMPSVLVECGFISNPSDLKTLRTKTGRDAIADDLLQAFSAFKKSYDSSMDDGKKQAAEAKRAHAISGEDKKSVTPETNDSINNRDRDTVTEETVQENPKNIYYGTQILATVKVMKKSDPFFKGYAPSVVKVGRIYKYIIGTDPDYKKATASYGKLKKLFPESFMVKVENGESSIIKY
ncbi:MAG: N-acetylmuramoyl-L-alanine amidase [Bacteroidales bacterium]|nr:N-acetylmuramoyl-L-alanine amidase [Bacteroidales bacterium]